MAAARSLATTLVLGVLRTPCAWLARAVGALDDALEVDFDLEDPWLDTATPASPPIAA